MASQVRVCDKCGSRIEITTKNDTKVVNITVSKNRQAGFRSPVMFNVTCGECRSWIEQMTS